MLLPTVGGLALSQDLRDYFIRNQLVLITQKN
jgi:hypothetical protein